MSVTIKYEDREIQELASRVGFCFVDQVHTLERLIDVRCGVSSVVSDEIYIDPAQFAKFLSKLMFRIDETNNGEFVALCIGCLQICLFLQNKITGAWPAVPSRLIPVLDGVKTLSRVDWKLIALQNGKATLQYKPSKPSDI